MDPKARFFQSTNLATEDQIKKYQRAIGFLHFLVMGTRPDIAYATNILSRFVSNPDAIHWQAIGKIYGYIKSTRSFSLTYSKCGWKPKGQSDANHGGDITSDITTPPRSFGAYIFTSAGGPISWTTKRQVKTAISSFDSETIALSKATSEAIYIKNYYEELGLNSGPVLIETDNNSIIQAMSAPKHKVTKTVNIAYWMIKEQVQEEMIKLSFIASANNTADALTKALTGPKIRALNHEMGLLADPEGKNLQKDGATEAL